LVAGHRRAPGDDLGGTNLAYELCLRTIADADLATLDLSHWRLAFNGAEAVNPATVRRFTQRLAPCGLRPESLFPVYGLAEAAAGLTFPPVGRTVPMTGGPANKSRLNERIELRLRHRSTGRWTLRSSTVIIHDGAAR
jgi:acyl-CoA synthetase (AMP-forming)/AMP-acid ligase II